MSKLQLIHNNRNRKGFTLLELLVSLLVLSISALGMVAFAITTMRGAQITEYITGATSVSHKALELLRTIDPAVLGSDSYAACTDANGKVVNSSDDGACMEDMINSRGRSQAEGVGSGPYLFRRYTVICSDTNTIQGGYTGDHCAIPSGNFNGGPLPTDLACNHSGESTVTGEKEIKVLTAWRDRTGKCHSYALRAIVEN